MKRLILLLLLFPVILSAQLTNRIVKADTLRSYLADSMHVKSRVHHYRPEKFDSALWLLQPLARAYSNAKISLLNGLSDSSITVRVDTSSIVNAPAWSASSPNLDLRLPFARMKDTSWSTLTPIVTGNATQVRQGITYFTAPQYFNDSVRFNNTLWANGTTGSTPTSGAGTRFMWIPSKWTLRGGRVTDARWDADSISDYTFGFGLNPQVDMEYSTVLNGNNNKITNWTGAGGAVYNTILNGENNQIEAGNSMVVNGSRNYAQGAVGCIFGDDNSIFSTGGIRRFVFGTLNTIDIAGSGISNVFNFGYYQKIRYGSVANFGIASAEDTLNYSHVYSFRNLPIMAFNRVSTTQYSAARIGLMHEQTSDSSWYELQSSKQSAGWMTGTSDFLINKYTGASSTLGATTYRTFFRFVSSDNTIHFNQQKTHGDAYGAVSVDSGDFIISAGKLRQASLTDGYFPYHVSDASGLGNSSLYQSGANTIQFGTTAPIGSYSNEKVFTIAAPAGSDNGAIIELQGTGSSSPGYYGSSINTFMGSTQVAAISVLTEDGIASGAMYFSTKTNAGSLTNSVKIGGSETLEAYGDIKGDTLIADVGVKFPDGTVQTTKATSYPFVGAAASFIDSTYAVPIASMNVLYKVTNAANNLFTQIVATSTTFAGDSITITTSGDYILNYCFSVGGISGHDYKIAIMKNWVKQFSLFVTYLGNAYSPISGTFYLNNLVNGDDISFAVENTNSTDDATFSDGSFTIQKVSD